MNSQRIVFILCLAFVSWSVPAGGDPPKQTRTELLLGTAVTITVYGRLDNEVLDEAFDRIAEIEARMSTTEEDYTNTELMRLNGAAGFGPVAVSTDTVEVVELALEFSEQSDGAFDVTVQPLVKLWGIGTENERVPDPSEIEEALARVGYGNVVVNPAAGTIELKRDGAGVDVGGIAKGYAADEVAELLREAGAESALLDFGGNIVTVGTKPDGTPWRIGVQTPDASRGEFLGIASVSDLSLVTSGTYERFFESGGVRYHHILDTKTGYPVQNGLASVTIITERSIDADALSTLVFALGLEKGLRFAENRTATEAILVTDDREVYTTSGVDRYFRITNPDYELRTN